MLKGGGKTNGGRGVLGCRRRQEEIQLGRKCELKLGTELIAPVKKWLVFEGV